MMDFLKKLDRQAGNMIEAMDNGLQEPLLRTMNGDVFRDGTQNDPVNGTPSASKIRLQAVKPVTPTAQVETTGETAMVCCPPAMTNASA